MMIVKYVPFGGVRRRRSPALLLRTFLTLAVTFVALATGPVSTASANTGGGKLPAGFVVLGDMQPAILQDIRYSTYHNFVGRPIDGYKQPLCILTRQAATALGRAQSALLRRGYTLKMYDCYRPQRAVNDFERWATRLNDTQMKGEFYPNVDKSTLFDQGYIASRSGHSRGSTVDLTIVKLPARPQRSYVRGEPLVPC